MEVEIKDGVLIIKIPIQNPPIPSASGKSLSVASTRGNVRTAVTVNGKPVTIGLNAYISKD